MATKAPRYKNSTPFTTTDEPYFSEEQKSPKERAPIRSRVFLTETQFLKRRKIIEHTALRSVRFDVASQNQKREETTTVEIPSFTPKKYEVWFGSGDVTREARDGMRLRSFGGMMLSTVESTASSKNLQEIAYALYVRLFTFLSSHPDQKLLRIWNYVPRILSQNNKGERYHQFNMGRYKAWHDFGPRTPNGELVYPAATGIGSHGDRLVVEALTTKDSVLYLQNPRQAPAHTYSKKYGPLPPVFSRASLHRSLAGAELYIAGTASIIGEDALWIGDPVKQTQETLRNIEILMSEENLATVGHHGFQFKDLSAVRVYIKHPEHLLQIKREVERVIDRKHVIYLHDDICREEWLLEIEGVARKA